MGDNVELWQGAGSELEAERRAKTKARGRSRGRAKTRAKGFAVDESEGDHGDAGPPLMDVGPLFIDEAKSSNSSEDKIVCGLRYVRWRGRICRHLW